MKYDGEQHAGPLSPAPAAAAAVSEGKHDLAEPQLYRTANMLPDGVQPIPGIGSSTPQCSPTSQPVNPVTQNPSQDPAYTLEPCSPAADKAAEQLAGSCHDSAATAASAESTQHPAEDADMRQFDYVFGSRTRAPCTLPPPARIPAHFGSPSCGGANTELVGVRWSVEQPDLPPASPQRSEVHLLTNRL